MLFSMELNLAKIPTCHSSLVNCHSIKNIIFDFGGVICNIDLRLTEKAFLDLGLKKFDTGRSISDSAGLFEDIETGAISPQVFRDGLRKFFEHPVTDVQLDSAWNAMLLDIPESRIRLLEETRKHYRIFLLSNSNEIHYHCYVQNFRKQSGYPDFDGLFEKSWFSCRIGLKKPSPEIFRYVLRDSKLDPSETLFIDDTLVHVEGARNAGIHGYHLILDKGEQITDLFYKNNA
jgi:HAD superfamily hydrolase (TIGR01549 family)